MNLVCTCTWSNRLRSPSIFTGFDQVTNQVHIPFFSCCLSRYICVRLHKTWWFGCVMWHLDHSFLCEGTLFKSNLLGHVNGYYMCMFRKKERLYWGPAPCMKSIWMTHAHTHTCTCMHWFEIFSLLVFLYLMIKCSF